MNNRWHGYLDAQVKNRPFAPAVSDSTGARWDYAELDKATSDVGRILESEGVNLGDRVVVLIENCAAAMAAVFAGLLGWSVRRRTSAVAKK